VTVYYTNNNRLISGQLPYETGVTRFVPSTRNLIGAVLDEYFKGPGDVERNQGLALVLNGFTGYSKLEYADGVAHVGIEFGREDVERLARVDRCAGAGRNRVLVRRRGDRVDHGDRRRARRVVTAARREAHRSHHLQATERPDDAAAPPKSRLRRDF